MYDPVETRLLESIVEAEEQTNHKVWNEALRLVHSSPSTSSDSDNVVFFRS